jgi:hypothetical protein
VSEPDLCAFVQDFAVREAIYALITETREPVDITQVIGRVRQRHPEIRLSIPELKQKVIGVADEAGLPVMGVAYGSTTWSIDVAA